MTKQEAIANHRKMWRWIAKQTRMQKRIIDKVEYFREFKLESVMSQCYCCEYAKCHCQECPIEWRGIGCSDGEYGKWLHAETWQEKAYWAEIIAELTERL